MFHYITVAIALLVTAQVARAENPPPAFVVIVNAAVKPTKMSKADVNAMFIKRMTRWPDEVAVTPFDQAVTAPVRATFSEGVFGKSAQAVMSEWRQRIFTGQGTPPREIRDDATMVAAVAGTPGAIGYVSAGTPLPATVHVLAIAE